MAPLNYQLHNSDATILCMHKHIAYCTTLSLHWHTDTKSNCNDISNMIEVSGEGRACISAGLEA